MAIDVPNARTVRPMRAGSRGVFGCLDFRGVLVRVASSSRRVASALIMRTTSRAEPVLVEEVVEVVVVVVVEMVRTMVARDPLVAR
jgi:hypothetical protein